MARHARHGTAATAALAAVALWVTGSAFAATPPTVPTVAPTPAVATTSENGDAVSDPYGPRQDDPHEKIRVVVELTDQPTIINPTVEKTRLAQQQTLLDEWIGKYGLDVHRSVGYLFNGFSATIERGKIDALAAEPEVASVKTETVYKPTENSARTAQGVEKAVEAARTQGLGDLDGSGQLISIIDTGIDTSHQDMKLDDMSCTGNEKIKKFDASRGFTCKVPAGYNYADHNWTIKDTTSNQHGMHVAGIVAANEGNGADKPASAGHIKGVAPNAQLLAMKVFSNEPSAGADDLDIVAAIEDSVKLHADVINMSLGSSNGTNESSDGTWQALERARRAGIIPVVSAGNEGANYSKTAELDNQLGYVDDATLSEPSVFTPAFSVASIENTTVVQHVASWRTGTSGEGNTIAYAPQTGQADAQWHDLVDFGYGTYEDFEKVWAAYATDEATGLKGKYLLAKRGKARFSDIYQWVELGKADGIVIYNSDGNEDFLALGGVDKYTFFSAALPNSTGEAIHAALASGQAVQVNFSQEEKPLPSSAALQPSVFTSWGPTANLDFKPQIAGIGGNVYSTVNDNKYATKSGTSMAAPNISGMTALLKQYWEKKGVTLSGSDLVSRMEIALQNTALIPSKDGLQYAPRQIGAGLAQIDKAIASQVVATVDGAGAATLRDFAGNKSFTVHLSAPAQDADYTITIPGTKVLSEHQEAGQPNTTYYSGDVIRAQTGSITVKAGQALDTDVTFTIAPQGQAQRYIEGWVSFTFEGIDQPQINVPYLGFYGDWNKDAIVGAPNVDIFQGTVEAGPRTWLQSPVTADFGTANQPMSYFRPYTFSPNGDGQFDRIAADIALLRNPYEVESSIVDSDGNTIAVVNKLGSLRRLSLKDAQAGGGFTSNIVGSFDGTYWDGKEYRTIADGDYSFRVKTRLGPDYDWQTTDIPFHVDTTAPVFDSVSAVEGGKLTFSAHDDYVPFTTQKNVVDANGINWVDSHYYSSSYLVTNTPYGVWARDDKGKALTVTKNKDLSYTVDVPQGADQPKYVVFSVSDWGRNRTFRTVMLGDNSLVLDKQDRDDSGDGSYNVLAGPTSFEVTGGSYKLVGYTSPSTTAVIVNGSEVPVSGGYFSTLVPLVDGLNTITVSTNNGKEGSGTQAGGVVGHQAQATDGEEAAGITRTLKVLYDSTPPELKVTSLDERGQIRSEQNKDGKLDVVVTGRVSDERAGATVTLQADAKYPITVNSDGTFNQKITVEDDQNYFVLIASDGVNSTTQGYYISGRAEAMVITITNLAGCDSSGSRLCMINAGDSALVKDGKVHIEGTVGTGFDKLVFQGPARVGDDGQYVDPDPVEVTPKNGRFSVDLPVTPVINIYQLSYYAGGQLIGSRSLRLYYDAEAPSLNFTAPAEVVDGKLVVHDDSVTIAGHIHDEGFGYKFVVNDQVVAQASETSVGGESTNGRDFSTEVAVRDGDEIVLRGVDYNANAFAFSVPVVVDQDKPQVSVTSDEGDFYDGASLTTSRKLQVAADDAHLDSMTVSLDGKVIHTADTQVPRESFTTFVKDTIGKQLGKSTADSAPSEADAQVAAPATELDQEVSMAGLSAGVHTLTVESMDYAGNTSLTVRSFVIDDPAVIEGPDSVTVEVASADGTTVDRKAVVKEVLSHYSVVDDGAVNSDGTVSTGNTLDVAPGVLFGPGENPQVTLVATDARGRVTTRVVSVTVTLVAAEGGNEGTDVPTPQPSGSAQPSEGTPRPTDSPSEQPGSSASPTAQPSAGGQDATAAPSAPGGKSDGKPASAADSENRYMLTHGGSTLPRTGTDSQVPLALASMAVIVGAGVLALRRRMQSNQAAHRVQRD